MGGPVDTFVVRLVLAMTVLTWGSVLVHDLVTPDTASEATLAPAAAVDGAPREGRALAPTALPTSPANVTEPRASR